MCFPMRESQSQTRELTIPHRSYGIPHMQPPEAESIEACAALIKYDQLGPKARR